MGRPARGEHRAYDRNQLSISLDDAYRLRDEVNAASEEHAAEEAARKAKLQAEIAKAQEKRQKVYPDAYIASMRAQNWPAGAGDAGRAAIEEAERNLDPAIRNQLGPVVVPDVRLGVGGFVGEKEEAF